MIDTPLVFSGLTTWLLCWFVKLRLEVPEIILSMLDVSTSGAGERANQICLVGQINDSRVSASTSSSSKRHNFFVSSYVLLFVLSNFYSKLKLLSDLLCSCELADLLIVRDQARGKFFESQFRPLMYQGMPMQQTS